MVENRDNEWKQLMYSIILQAIRDLKRDKLSDDALDFITSDWCHDICDGLGINYELFCDNVFTRYSKYIII